ncbi:MAG: MFS transporter [Actinomycetota bacterium]
MRTFEPIPGRAWVILGVASSTVVLIILDSGFISLAFPEIEAEFVDTGRSTLSWISSGYFIAMASLMLVTGRLAERVGRRRVFLGGLAIYALGALVMAVAPTPVSLIGARLVQGAGAAALAPVSLAIALKEFPTGRRSTAIGGWAVIGGSSGVLAPTLGAILVDAFGWRAPFVLLAALLGAVGFVATRVLEVDARPGTPPAIDLHSVPLAIAAVGGSALVLTEVRNWGLIDGRLIAAVAVAAIAAVVLLRRSRSVPGSLIDLALFRIPSYSIGSLASVFSQVGFFAFFFTAPLFFTQVWGYSVLTAGFALAFHQGVSAIVGLPLGRLADRIGVRWIVGCGGLMAAVSFVLMVSFVDSTPQLVSVVLPAFLLGGIGTMANGAFTTSIALREIGDDAMTRASSGYYVARRLASGLGVVIGAALLGDASGAQRVDDFERVWVFAAACYALSGLIAFADRDKTGLLDLARRSRSS